MRFLTRAVRGSKNTDPAWGATEPPVYFSAAFEKEDPEELARLFEGREAGFIYSRIGNPTVASFEQAFSALVSARGAVAVSSGMAAITSIIFALAESGSRIAVSCSLFGGTIALLKGVVARAGIETIFFDPLDDKSVESVLSCDVSFVFVEMIGNPRMDVPDIDRISELAHSRGIPVIADCTLTPPGVFLPEKHGVDVAVHSLTKYITGNGTVVGGIIVDTGLFDWTEYKSETIAAAAKKAGDFALLYVIRKDIVQNMGFSLSPMHAFLHYLGLETLPLRIHQHCKNAIELAKFLAQNRHVSRVRYPGLKEDESYPVAARIFEGLFGGLLTFELGSREECYDLIRALTIPRSLVNLGAASSLVVHPASTIYADASSSDKKGAGVTDGLIRVSVGIEDTADLIEDFDRAITKIYKR